MTCHAGVRRAVPAAALAILAGLLGVASHAQPAPADLGLPAEPLLGFVSVPAGPFVMGTAAPPAFDNERWSPGAAKAQSRSTPSSSRGTR